MMLSKIVQIFRDEKAAPLLSFIIGLGVIVMLFHRPFVTNQILAIPVSDIEGKVVKQGAKCFEYHAEDSQCEISPSK
jgi:hypothetical protein